MYISKTGDTVKILKESGEFVDVPFELLSDSDRNYVARMPAGMREQQLQLGAHEAWGEEWRPSASTVEPPRNCLKLLRPRNLRSQPWKLQKSSWRKKAKHNRSGSTGSARTDDSTTYPYKFFASRTEGFGPAGSGLRNVMDLYSFSGPLDPSTLASFCRQRKAASNADAFYYVVIFDSPANAAFPVRPSQPNTALTNNHCGTFEPSTATTT